MAAPLYFSKSMSGRTFAIIDPAAGISGDMLLGAILAAGASPEWLTGLPARLGIPEVLVEIGTADRCGLQCVKVTVRTGDGVSEPPDHGHGHAHGHGPHRHVGQLIRMIEEAPLSPWVRERATMAFRRLGEAEGRIHGVPADRVALHEVGAFDALIDIVGGIEGFEQLGVSEIAAWPVALGSGWVTAAHGRLPVPAPATAILVEGLALAADGPVEGEATTPTGAVLLQVLAGAPLPARWRIIRSGWGAGTRNPPGYPNALRVILGEAAEEAAEVAVVAGDLDDLSPEYLAPLREALVAAGALDVQAWATHMKKDRVGFRVEAIVPLGGEQRVAEAFLANSTSAGVRWSRAGRLTLARRTIEVDAGDGLTIRAKVLETPTGPRVKPEYDDVTRVARATGRPAHQVAAEARSAGERAVAAAVARHDFEHKEST
ncbi:MAG TPA: nickel pincer cofactor biosynthesis protein LarC [Gemmatimonadales bacterium]|nr:nickel pincer cofactor biosynthesis protein LarC [Gemmatimonadales bacterium]